MIQPMRREMEGRKVLGFIIVFLFCIFSSYNIAEWNYERKINSIETNFDEQIEDIRTLIEYDAPKEQVLEQLDSLEQQIKFQQSFFLEEAEYNVVYE